MQESILQIIYLLPALLLSLSFHEFSHGYVSYLLGDPTAKMQGRLTLNPIAHLDPIGALVLIVTRRFGWAKPVPINPGYYKNPRKGMMYVSIAGPGANILLAILFAIILHIVLWVNEIQYFVLLAENFYYLRYYYDVSDMLLIIFNMLRMGIIINLSLAVFNLLPFPPLDGSKILRGFLPRKYDQIFYTLEGPLGMMLIIFLVFTGLLGNIIIPVIYYGSRLLGF